MTRIRKALGALGGDHRDRFQELPRRVRELIATEEALSERLIGWVQLAIVATITALFLLAPRPGDAPMFALSEPVPVVLLAYAVFTIIRLALSYRGPLPAVLLIVSILADVALLLVLIWMFHDQYGHAAPFSLKVPTFIYLFVFVALRALRFDQRYVFASGMAAALGWLVLVLAVLWKSGPAAITNKFTDYLTGDRILVGAEIEKVLVVILVTAILTFAVARGRAMFVAAFRGEAAARDLGRFLQQGLADTIAHAREPLRAGTAAERDAAILILDIRGFTSYAATATPNDIVAGLTALHGIVVPIIRRHGGVVDKFLGDGLMATFGALEPSDHAARSVMEALEDILRATAGWRPTTPGDGRAAHCEVNAAAVAGRVVFAVLGADERLEYTVIGDPANLAAKLEKLNKSQGSRALVPSATLAQAIEQGFAAGERWGRPHQVVVAGLAEPLDVIARA